MDYKRIIFSLLLTFISAISVTLIWKYSVILILLILLISFIKHKIYPLKKEFQIFVIAGLLGSGMESMIMLSGAWAYSQLQIFNFPVWLPFLWGLAGTLGITIYQGLIYHK